MERAASFLLFILGGASIHQRKLKVLSEPCWIVTYHTALTQTQPVLDPGGQSQSAGSFAPYFEMLLPADQAAALL